jgi:hypothetical protein
MASLTSILPQLAPILGLSTAALYERQRSLVRLELLPKPKGRGRGSGADASPETVALLMMAVMATDNLSDNDDRIVKLASASFDARKVPKCELTGATTFAMAVATILAAPNIAAALQMITVTRSDLSAAIYYIRGSRKLTELPRAFPTDPPRYRNTPSKSRTSIFGHEYLQIDRLRIEASLYGGAVREIARILASQNEGNCQ